ncbi:UNKNOWN [Stylonychia lemnae]|uniref:Uncharacterized protein n=1 Tax=Stylonychia lemnae TaxID=5949 RepID=A0A078AKI2_STYLE|nr:UNKNOWN [Stylonychia lemnae]|eukprot:CDW82381.1 UNKNOWN [Stylonychia lemnae]
MSKDIKRQAVKPPAGKFQLFKCCIKSQPSQKGKNNTIDQITEDENKKIKQLEMITPNEYYDSPPHQTKTPQITQDMKQNPNKQVFDFKDHILGQGAGQHDKEFLNQSRASIERSLRDIDLVFQNDQMKAIKTVKQDSNKKSSQKLDNLLRSSFRKNFHPSQSKMDELGEVKSPEFRAQSTSPQSNQNYIQKSKEEDQKISPEIENKRSFAKSIVSKSELSDRQKEIIAKSPLLLVKIISDDAQTPMLNDDEEASDFDEFGDERKSSQLDSLKQLNNRFSQHRRILSNHQRGGEINDQNINRAGTINVTKDYVSYSLHSINMQKSQTTFSNQFIDDQKVQSHTAEQLNKFQNLIINESSSEHQTSSGNIQQQSHLKTLNNYKVPTFSVSSYNSSHNNYKMIGDFGHISPIIKHQSTESKSLNSINLEDNNIVLPQQKQLNYQIMGNQMAAGQMQGNQRSSVDNYEIMNELRKHGGLLYNNINSNKNDCPQQNSIIQVNNMLLPNQAQTFVNIENQRKGQKNSKIPFEIAAQNLNLPSLAQRDSSNTNSNQSQNSNKQSNSQNFPLQSDFQPSTLSNTPRNKDLNNSENQQVMVPLHLVEAYYQQILYEKDAALHKSYNQIAKLSSKVGNLQSKIKEQKQEVKRFRDENLDLRSQMNYVLQAKLLEGLQYKSV